MALGRSAGITASALMGNARMTDTFYGVAPAYATATRPAFDARGGLIAWRLAASGGMHLTRDWSLFAYGRIDSVDGAANRASPLVDRRVGASVGVGLSWTGLYSDSAAND
jgi:outer membrane scaffolding protein for murein synthesis (MipA/OmpV family)